MLYAQGNENTQHFSCKAYRDEATRKTWVGINSRIILKCTGISRKLDDRALNGFK
jgi:hypothetical protein